MKLIRLKINNSFLFVLLFFSQCVFSMESVKEESGEYYIEEEILHAFMVRLIGESEENIKKLKNEENILGNISTMKATFESKKNNKSFENDNEEQLFLSLFLLFGEYEYKKYLHYGQILIIIKRGLAVLRDAEEYNKLLTEKEQIDINQYQENFINHVKRIVYNNIKEKKFSADFLKLYDACCNDEEGNIYLFNDVVGESDYFLHNEIMKILSDYKESCKNAFIQLEEIFNSAKQEHKKYQEQQKNVQKSKKEDAKQVEETVQNKAMCLSRLSGEAFDIVYNRIEELYNGEYKDLAKNFITAFAPFILYQIINNKKLEDKQELEDKEKLEDNKKLEDKEGGKEKKKPLSLFGFLLSADVCPERDLISGNIIEIQTMSTIIANYIKRVQPNDDEFIELMLFIDEKMKKFGFKTKQLVPLFELCRKKITALSSIEENKSLKEYLNKNIEKLLAFFDDKLISYDDVAKKGLCVVSASIYEGGESFENLIDQFHYTKNNFHVKKCHAINELNELVELYEICLYEQINEGIKEINDIEKKYQQDKNDYCEKINNDLNNKNFLQYIDKGIGALSNVLGFFKKKINQGNALQRRQEEFKNKIVDRIFADKIDCAKKEVIKVENEEIQAEGTIGVLLEGIDFEDLEDIDLNDYNDVSQLKTMQQQQVFEQKKELIKGLNDVQDDKDLLKRREELFEDINKLLQQQAKYNDEKIKEQQKNLQKKRNNDYVAHKNNLDEKFSKKKIKLDTAVVITQQLGGKKEEIASAINIEGLWKVKDELDLLEKLLGYKEKNIKDDDFFKYVDWLWCIVDYKKKNSNLNSCELFQYIIEKVICVGQNEEVLLFNDLGEKKLDANDKLDVYKAIASQSYLNIITASFIPSNLYKKYIQLKLSCNLTGELTDKLNKYFNLIPFSSDTCKKEWVLNIFEEEYEKYKNKKNQLDNIVNNTTILLNIITDKQYGKLLPVCNLMCELFNYYKKRKKDKKVLELFEEHYAEKIANEIIQNTDQYGLIKENNQDLLDDIKYKMIENYDLWFGICCNISEDSKKENFINVIFEQTEFINKNFINVDSLMKKIYFLREINNKAIKKRNASNLQRKKRLLDKTFFKAYCKIPLERFQEYEVSSQYIYMKTILDKKNKKDSIEEKEQENNGNTLYTLPEDDILDGDLVHYTCGKVPICNVTRTKNGKEYLYKYAIKAEKSVWFLNAHFFNNWPKGDWNKMFFAFFDLMIHTALSAMSNEDLREKDINFISPLIGAGSYLPKGDHIDQNEIASAYMDGLKKAMEKHKDKVKSMKYTFYCKGDEKVDEANTISNLLVEKITNNKQTNICVQKETSLYDYKNIEKEYEHVFVNAGHVPMKDKYLGEGGGFEPAVVYGLSSDAFLPNAVEGGNKWEYVIPLAFFAYPRFLIESIYKEKEGKVMASSIQNKYYSECGEAPEINERKKESFSDCNSQKGSNNHEEKRRFWVDPVDDETYNNKKDALEDVVPFKEYCQLIQGDDNCLKVNAFLYGENNLNFKTDFEKYSLLHCIKNFNLKARDIFFVDFNGKMPSNIQECVNNVINFCSKNNIKLSVEDISNFMKVISTEFLNKDLDFFRQLEEEGEKDYIDRMDNKIAFMSKMLDELITAFLSQDDAIVKKNKLALMGKIYDNWLENDYSLQSNELRRGKSERDFQSKNPNHSVGESVERILKSEENQYRVVFNNFENKEVKREKIPEKSFKEIFSDSINDACNKINKEVTLIKSEELKKFLNETKMNEIAMIKSSPSIGKFYYGEKKQYLCEEDEYKSKPGEHGIIAHFVYSNIEHKDFNIVDFAEQIIQSGIDDKEVKALFVGDKSLFYIQFLLSALSEQLENVCNDDIVTDQKKKLLERVVKKLLNIKCNNAIKQCSIPALLLFVLSGVGGLSCTQKGMFCENYIGEKIAQFCNEKTPSFVQHMMNSMPEVNTPSCVKSLINTIKGNKKAFLYGLLVPGVVYYMVKSLKKLSGIKKENNILKIFFLNQIREFGNLKKKE